MRSWLMLIFFCPLVLQILGVEEIFGDNEGINHNHHHHSHSDRDGAHVFRERLADMEGSSLEDRFKQLVKQIDTDNSGTISSEELASWISKSYQREDEEESLSKLPDYDLNSDGHVSWSELLKAVYGYEEQDVALWATDENREVQELYRMVKSDEDRFRAADVNRDGQLNVQEFSAYLHPYDYEYMHDVELDRVMQDYDMNKDGVISLSEYSRRSLESMNSEDAIVDRENFAAYDRNSDGKLDRHEIHQWAIPDHADIAQEDTYKLFQMSDDDGDKQLSVDEIINHEDLWLGSSATGYGQHLGHQHHDEGEL